MESKPNPTYRLKIENGEFWRDEEDDEHSQELVFVTLAGAILCAEEFLMDTREAGMDYEPEDIIFVDSNGVEKDMMDMLDELAEQYDLPFADGTVVPFTAGAFCLVCGIM